MRAAHVGGLALVALLATSMPAAARSPECAADLADLASGIATGQWVRKVASPATCGDDPASLLIVGITAARFADHKTAGEALGRVEEDPMLGAEGSFAGGIWSLTVGDMHSARQNFLTAVRADPEHGPSRVGLILLAARAGDRKGARREAAALVRHPGEVDGPEDLELRHGYLRSAAVALEAATSRLAPGCARCWRTLADLHVGQAGGLPAWVAVPHWEAASKALRAAIEAGDRGTSTYVALGRVRNELGDHRGALDAYTAVTETRPDWPPGHLLRAASALDVNRPEEAARLLEGLIRAAGGKADTRTWSLLGVARRDLGRDDATDAYVRAVAVANPSSGDLANLGTLLMVRGKLAPARARFQQALAIDPELKAARYGLALALRELGKPKLADLELARYRELLSALEARVTAEEALSNHDISASRALRALREGRPDEAREISRGVLAEDEGHGLAHLAAAVVDARRGRDPGPHLEAIVQACVRANQWFEPERR